MNSLFCQRDIKSKLLLALCLLTLSTTAEELDSRKEPDDTVLPNWAVPVAIGGSIAGVTAAMAWGLNQKQRCVATLSQLAINKIELANAENAIQTLRAENKHLKTQLSRKGSENPTTPPAPVVDKYLVQDGRVPKLGPIASNLSPAELDKLMDDLISEDAGKPPAVPEQNPSNPTSSESNSLQMRWMIRRDMREVLDMQAQSFMTPWTEAELISALRHRNAIGMIVENKEGKVIGFVVYELHRDRLEVINLAIDRQQRSEDVGTTILDKLKTKLSPHTRNSIYANIPETNLAAQQFFSSQDFTATRPLRNTETNTAIDKYRFVYQLPSNSERGEKREK